VTRLTILCEVLHPPLDEGVRIVAAELAHAFSRRLKVTLLGMRDAEVAGLAVEGVLTDRFFVGSALARSLLAARPEAMLYIPWTSLTPRTLLRVAMLRRRSPGVPIGVLAMQPRGAGWLARLGCRLGKPDRVFATGPTVERQATELEIPITRLEGGVDLDRFRPRGEESMSDLRKRLGLHTSPYLVLHVGHLKPSRGILALKAVQALEGVQALLITSTSTAADADTRRELQESGVRVIDHSLPNVDDFYRAADCYLFPVTSSLDAIELPLSILEAMATNLPIITSRFGGVPELLDGAGPGVAFAAAQEEFPRLVMAFRKDRPRPALRDRVRSLTWDAMSARITEALSGTPEKPLTRDSEIRG